MSRSVSTYLRRARNSAFSCSSCERELWRARCHLCNRLSLMPRACATERTACPWSIHPLS
jgi:hypothetical protein